MDFSPTNGVSSGGVTVTGTVTVPATASSSISVAQAGKSAGFSVSKAEALPPSFAVSDVTPDSGIAVLQPLEDATVTLGTCSVVNGSLSGCKFDDLSKLGASKQVEAVWKVSNGNSIYYSYLPW
ncbi:MAG: hypothetical protein Q7S68_06015 [Deltaproteobacteria bacterium]|nr:hypothetical protein [Deltaproteobacteria bacterium]